MTPPADTHPQAPARPADAAGRSTPLPKPDGFRDTMESLIIAFIFAFVFRAFVVEAFVIPTGSMAPTLLGLHGKHRCAACRYPYTYGIKDEVVHQGHVIPGTLALGRFASRCPNCGWSGEGNILHDVEPRQRVIPDAGDRILVLKWPYDIGGSYLAPHRWDVVVFKNPKNGEDNYIKRLIGMPGEVIELIDGDVYAAPAASLSAELLEALARPARPRGGNSGRDLSPALQAELDRRLAIARKTDLAQESLWMLHYDHDYPPDPATQSRNPLSPAWTPIPRPDGRSPWMSQTPRVVCTPIDDEAHFIRLTGKPIRDSYGYNDIRHGDDSGSARGGDDEVNVGDVKLTFVLTVASGDGEVHLVLRKAEDEFRARMSADGTMILERRHGRAAPVQLAKAALEPLAPGRSVTVEFQNVDYRVSLSVDGRPVLTTTDRDYAPDIPSLRSRSERLSAASSVEIGARRLALEIRHLVTYRDVYYRSTGRGRDPLWGTTNHPLFLRDHPVEYFCCGDNSPQSEDSRLWFDVEGSTVPRVIAKLMEPHGGYQLGTVPGEQMIGRAFFVYWPGGIRPWRASIPVIPDFGRMRIIR